MRHVVPVLFLLLLALSLPAVADIPATGWRRIEVPGTGSYLWRYIPDSLDRSRPAPVVLFFHGSGGSPDKYKAFVIDAAEAARAVVVLPKSSTGEGWGTADDNRTVTESLARVREEMPVDLHRVAVAGHSAGGAYAYLLAYTTRSGYSAVFSLAARHYSVAQVADPAYKAPIRMYYGTSDPNYAGGSYAALKQQWQRLGVAWEEEIGAGLGHNTLPPDAMVNGFTFLAARRHPAGVPGCSPGETTLCLGNGRFRVEVAWKDFQGGEGVGTVVPGASSADTGLFWFFAPANWEMMVKVLDGCGVNGHHWVFAAATTNVEYTLTVTDTRTGQTATWHNPLGRSAPAVTATEALGGCP